MARIDLANWIAAEKRHTGDEPGEHKEELEAQNKIEKAYSDINSTCDWVIALAGSGQRAEAITDLEQAVDGPSGQAVTDTLDCESDRPVITVKRLDDDPEGRHRYLVRDNGKGIPPESLKKIFEPFFKGDTGGTGIGLATVAKIVDVYGGKAQAYNDNGACFEFTLKDYDSPGLRHP